MDYFVDFCLKIRLLYPDKIIVAGNAITTEMVNILVIKAVVKIQYKGQIENTIQNVLGGLRSTCVYIWAKKIEEMSDKI